MSVHGRIRVYVTARLAPFLTERSPFATTWFSLRLRVPRPRYLPRFGSTTPDEDTIGSVGSGNVSSQILVSGNGYAASNASLVC